MRPQSDPTGNYSCCFNEERLNNTIVTSLQEKEKEVIQTGSKENYTTSAGNIYVNNSSDTHIGNKTYYQGPVTIIKQLLPNESSDKRFEKGGDSFKNIDCGLNIHVQHEDEDNSGSCQNNVECAHDKSQSFNPNQISDKGFVTTSVKTGRLLKLM